MFLHPPHYQRRVLADFLSQPEIARLQRIAFLWSWVRDPTR